MTRYRMNPEQLTSQACQRRAAEMMADAQDRNLTREMSRDIVAQAQVWATLAVVPDPLETVHGQVLESRTNEYGYAEFPALECPHGTVMLLQPRDESGWKYVATDCEKCP